MLNPPWRYWFIFYTFLGIFGSQNMDIVQGTAMKSVATISFIAATERWGSLRIRISCASINYKLVMGQRILPEYFFLINPTILY
jgi:hypothetical protein